MRDIKPFMRSFATWASREIRRPTDEWLLHPMEWLLVLSTLGASMIAIFSWLEERPTSLVSAVWPLICMIFMAGARLSHKAYLGMRDNCDKLMELCNDWQKLYERREKQITVKRAFH